MLRSRKRTIWAAVILVVAMTGTAFAGNAAVEAVNAVEFQVGDATGVFILNTTSDPAREEAVLPCRFRVTGSDAPANVGLIQLKVDYNVDELQFVDWSADDFGQGTAYWTGEFDVVDTNGTIVIMLDNAVLPAPTDFTALVYLKFTPLCQAELNSSPVDIKFAASESFVSYDNIRYYDLGDAARNGSVTVADYEVNVSVIDPDPLDGDAVTINLQGVIGAGEVIDVDFFVSANANVQRIQSLVRFDPTRLEPVTFTPGDGCNQWDWGQQEPTATDDWFYLDLINSSAAGNDTGSPCRFLTVQFRVVGDWAGGTTTIGFEMPHYWSVIGNSVGNSCSPLIDTINWWDGSVSIEGYQTTAEAVVSDHIWEADIAAGFKIFNTDIAVSNNYTMGGATPEALRFNLDLAPDMNILNLYQPDPGNPDPGNPLDDFWFRYSVESAKSPQQLLNLFTEYKAGLPNQRGPTPASLPVVSMEFIQQNVVRPATFDEHAVAFAYACGRNGVPARILDAVTDTLETNCADGNMILVGSPRLDYAAAELSCDARTSTRPSDVVQEYWVRSSYELRDFTATVTKTGPHGIVSVAAAAGVEVVAQGSDFVTFGPATDWVPGVFETRRLLGSIIYNTTTVPVVVLTGNLNKDIGPRTNWCWDTTVIGFTADFQLQDGSGDRPSVYLIENNIGTKWDCTIGNPADLLKSAGVPTAYALGDNFPNPFNPQTVIAFDVPAASAVKVEVLDLRGRRVRTLVNDVMVAGRHEVQWNGQDQAGRRVASGTYFVRMQAGGFSQLKKMLLLK